MLLGWQTGTGKEGAQALTITQSAGQSGGTSGSGSGSPGTDAGSGGSTGDTSSPATSSGAASSNAGSSSSSSSSSSNAAISGTFKGTSVGTRFGSVQVQVTIVKGAITDVSALQLTDRDNRSVSISNRAAPVLRSEVLTAQSANVQTIGGATYTSEGYLSSLQAALDSARFQTQVGG
jgi:uncharacterized protein with FMN-binding domain